MEAWTVETDDDDGHLGVHSFRPRAAASIPGDPSTAGADVVLVYDTLVAHSLYWPFARNLSVMLGRPGKQLAAGIAGYLAQGKRRRRHPRMKR